MGVDLTFDRGVFRRQTEGVPSHRVQHVEALRRLVACDHVSERVIPDVSHMDASRRIREHLQHVILLLAGVDIDLEAAGVRPRGLPSCFAFLHVISRHGWFAAASVLTIELEPGAWPDRLSVPGSPYWPEVCCIRICRARVRITSPRSLPIASSARASTQTSASPFSWRNTFARMPSDRSARSRI